MPRPRRLAAFALAAALAAAFAVPSAAGIRHRMRRPPASPGPALLVRSPERPRVGGPAVDVRPAPVREPPSDWGTIYSAGGSPAPARGPSRTEAAAPAARGEPWPH